MSQSLANSRRAAARANLLAAGAACLILLILGALTYAVQKKVQQALRQQMLQHHADLYHTLLINQDFEESLSALTEDPADQLFAILLTSELPAMADVLATRLFDRSGEFVMAFPNEVPDSPALNASVMERLRQLEPVGLFHPEKPLSELSWLYQPPQGEPSASEPVVEVLLPLHRPGEGQLLGVAQFFLDGHKTAKAFSALEQTVHKNAWIVFLGGGGAMVAALGLAFQRLRRANRLLAERTRSLLQANQELTMAAKTSAIGAVTSHLIHGLKNPLFGLHNYVAKKNAGDSPDSDTEWRSAVDSAQRMQSMIDEIVRVLREQSSSAAYLISFEELSEMAAERIKGREQGRHVEWTTRADGELNNRDANLILLILENLVINAIQATPPGKAVSVRFDAGPEGQVVCRIRDQGEGLPAAVQERLFMPCKSGKQDGAGIGLAISKQMANQLSASLELQETGPSGTEFSLSLPRKILAAESLAPETIAHS